MSLLVVFCSSISILQENTNNKENVDHLPQGVNATLVDGSDEHIILKTGMHLCQVPLF